MNIKLHRPCVAFDGGIRAQRLPGSSTVTIAVGGPSTEAL